MFKKQKYLNKKFNITIKSVNRFGRGVSDLNGIKIFVDGVKADDSCFVKIYFACKNFLEAEVIKFNDGQDKYNISCPHFYQCGGCDFLHLSFEEEKQIKLNSALWYLGQVFENVPKPKYVHCDEKRIRAKFNFKFNNKYYECGFFKRKSYKIVQINNCIIFDEAIINCAYSINDFLNNNKINIGDFTLNITLLDNGIDIVIETYNDDFVFNPDIIEMFNLQLNFGCDVNIWQKNGMHYIPIVYKNDLYKTIGGKKIIHNKGRFLQPQVKGRKEIENFIHMNIKQYLNKNSLIADLFCGSASFALGIEDDYKYDCFEIENESINELKNLHINNVECYVRNLFDNPLTIGELTKYSLVIVNPPRLGCEKQFVNIVNSNVDYIIYVSCNINTMISDFKKSCVENKYNILHVDIINQFWGSKHFETLVLLKNKNI